MGQTFCRKDTGISKRIKNKRKSIKKLVNDLDSFQNLMDDLKKDGVDVDSSFEHKKTKYKNIKKLRSD